jgi:hypothetical protein
MMSKITPGPWKACSAHARWAVSSGEYVHDLCECYGPEREANARAIAALPDLMEAADRVHMMWLEGAEYLDKEMDALRAALLKAKGGGE